MNKKKPLKNIYLFASILSGFIIVGLCVLVMFSPYGKHENHDYKLLKKSVLINAPVDRVYTYLGNSDNARDWSVFVDHITSLNSDVISDGEKGSVRRCFVNTDESGETWDEKVLIVEENKRRRLSCYNYKNFAITAGELQTDQIYEATKDGKCLLTFTLFFPPKESTFWKRMKMYYAAYQVADIFESNLKNIKRFNESGDE